MHSEDFTLGNASIYSSAISFRSQRDIDDNVAMLRSPKLANCFAQLKWFGQSGSFKITPGSAGGPANVIANATGNVKVGEQGQVTFYISAAYITGPLIQADVSAVSAGPPVPVSVMRLLAAAVASRAAKGGSSP